MIGEPLGHGFRVLRFATVTSTNDLARGFAESGEPEGLFVLGEQQTAGRGRQGRGWLSPPGNLYSSLLLRPKIELAAAASLSLVVALAVAETIDVLSRNQIRPQVKWPNDVLVGERKIAGILLESSVGAGGRCAWIIVGVGVNLGWSPGATVGYATTSLAELGLPDVTPDLFLGTYAPVLRGRLDLWTGRGFAGLRDAWLARAARLGELVELRVGPAQWKGRFLDVDPSGSLLLEAEPGRIERITAGELLVI